MLARLFDQFSPHGSTSTVEIRRSYRYALRPTDAQERVLVAQLDAHRLIYNCALDHRRMAYRMVGVSITYYDQARELVAIRVDDPHQKACNHSNQQHTLRWLHRAFQAFFCRIKVGQEPGFPRFRGRNRFRTLTFTHGDGATFTETGLIPERFFYKLRILSRCQGPFCSF